VAKKRKTVPGRVPTGDTTAGDTTNELTLDDGLPANRRRSTRIPLRVWAENRGWEEFCMWLQAEDIKQDFAFCYRTSDLSSEGVFLETTTPLDKGTEMDLAFRLPGSERTIRAMAKWSAWWPAARSRRRGWRCSSKKWTRRTGPISMHS